LSNDMAQQLMKVSARSGEDQALMDKDIIILGVGCRDFWSYFLIAPAGEGGEGIMLFVHVFNDICDRLNQD
jgi:hypothetical protein